MSMTGIKVLRPLRPCCGRLPTALGTHRFLRTAGPTCCAWAGLSTRRPCGWVMPARVHSRTRCGMTVTSAPARCATRYERCSKVDTAAGASIRR